MNSQLQTFARQYIKDGLAKLDEGNHHTFKLMYARNGGRRSVADAVAMPINDVVDKIPEEKLDWAMQQVDRSIAKKGHS